MRVILCPGTFKSSSNVREFYRTVLDTESASYMTFVPLKQEYAQINTVTAEMKEQAQKVIIEVVQKYFGSQFMHNRLNMKDSGNSNVFEKVDLRLDMYDQLKLEKYSPIGQVRALLAIDGLNLILNQ